MNWFKNLFSTPHKTDVEMKMPPQEKLRALEKEILELEKDSIERLQKEIEYNELSYKLNPGLIPKGIYENEMTRLNRLLSKKMGEQAQKDWNGAGGKRTKSKKAKARSKSKKLKRSKAKPRSRKQKK
jgi:hypothetical protein